MHFRSGFGRDVSEENGLYVLDLDYVELGLKDLEPCW